MTFWRDVPTFGVYFGVYEITAEYTKPYRKGPISTLLSILLSGTLSGISASGMIYPVDIRKTKVQTTPFLTHKERERLNQKSIRKPTWKIVRDTYRQGGINAFYRGLSVTLLRAVLFNAGFFPVYEVLKWLTHPSDYQE